MEYENLMLYKLCKLSFGTSKPEKVFDIDTDFIITSMCHIEKFGFLFLFRDNHFIGYSDYHGKVSFPWMGDINVKGDREGTDPLLNYPSSLCYSPFSKQCFLIEAGGTKIRLLDILPKYCANMPISLDFSRYFSKIPSVDRLETSCDVDKYGNLYWAVQKLHRCFRMDKGDNKVINYIGSGRSGFAVSNNLCNCLLSNPSSIKCVDASLYIADGANHCIRKTTNEVISIVAGNPLDEKILSFPSQIIYNNCIIYILDKHHIKYFSLKDQNTGIIYSSPNIVAIEGNIKKDIYVLESYAKENRRD